MRIASSKRWLIYIAAINLAVWNIWVAKYEKKCLSSKFSNFYYQFSLWTYETAYRLLCINSCWRCCRPTLITLVVVFKLNTRTVASSYRYAIIQVCHHYTGMPSSHTWGHHGIIIQVCHHTSVPSLYRYAIITHVWGHHGIVIQVCHHTSVPSLYRYAIITHIWGHHGIIIIQVLCHSKVTICYKWQLWRIISSLLYKQAAIIFYAPPSCC